MINGGNTGEKGLGGRTETGSLSPLALFFSLYLSFSLPLGFGTATIPLFYVHTFLCVSLKRSLSSLELIFRASLRRSAEEYSRERDRQAGFTLLRGISMASSVSCKNASAGTCTEDRGDRQTLAQGYLTGKHT